MQGGRFVASAIVAFGLLGAAGAHLAAQHAPATNRRLTPIDLLAWKAVCVEIELDKEQAHELAAILAQMEREWNAAERRITAKYQARVMTRVLLPYQSERLEQIALQLRGIAVFGDAEFGKRLGLSDRQRGDISRRLDKAREKFEDVRGTDVPPLERFAYLRRVRQGVEDSILKVLTEEQRREFAKMKGEPFGPEKLYAVEPEPMPAVPKKTP